MDVWSRSQIGWSMPNTLHAKIATDALTMAAKRKSLLTGLVHHSDCGVQYACRACRDILEQHGMKQSISRAGDFYDNAMMKSLWATLKKELVQRARLKTRAQARSSIFKWIEVWYQRKRSHSSLGYLSPEQFEAARRAGSYDCVSTESGEVHSLTTIPRKRLGVAHCVHMRDEESR